MHPSPGYSNINGVNLGNLHRCVTMQNALDKHKQVIMMESHDLSSEQQNEDKRFREQLVDKGEHGRRVSLLGHAFVILSPGIPMLFQGDEVDLWSEAGNEKDMYPFWFDQSKPEGERYRSSLDGLRQASKNSEYYVEISRLISIRKRFLGWGVAEYDAELSDEDRKVLVIKRTCGNDGGTEPKLVVYNLSNKGHELQLNGTYDVVYASGDQKAEGVEVLNLRPFQVCVCVPLGGA
eukprot:TRINITY_DN20494_c0_g1_i3.p1 TRINITY_DN20494_c0_g1~~TRINITY_DN20494_c0_g1_i3.p1  ORF type:complete len:235 (-),score=34.47 TRINITY_DN20494_c0_g1_i3:56-760(-)